MFVDKHDESTEGERLSLKRSHTSGRSSFGGGGDAGAKVDRQELFDELKRFGAANEPFTPVDVALAIGAGEPQVSKALLGLAAEGYLEKVDVGKYRASGMADLGQAEFLKAFARASRVDSTRQRDLSEIARLKQNNDTMRQRLLAAIAEKRPLPGGAQAARHRPRAARPRPRSPPPRPPPARAPASLRGGPLAAPTPTNAPGPAGLAVPSPPRPTRLRPWGRGCPGAGESDEPDAEQDDHR